MFSSLHHERDEVILLLDISSGYVEGALVELSASKPPHLIFSSKYPFSMSEEKKAARIKTSLRKAVDEVTHKIQREGLSHLTFTHLGHHKIRSVYCVLSSPWYISQTKIIKIDKEKPVSVTTSFLEGIILQEKTSFENDIKNGEYSDNFKNSVEILESKVIRVKLNGYETPSPHGKSAKNIEVALYMSLGDKETLDTIRDSVRKNINYKTIHFNTFPLVLFGSVKDVTRGVADFILLDVREEVTDISIIKNNLLLETVTIPAGSNFFVKRIASSLGTLPEVAHSYLRLYNENKTEAETKAKIAEQISIIKKDWLSPFEFALKSFSEEFFIPKTLYILVQDDFVPVFSETLGNYQFEQYAGDRVPFTEFFLGKEFKNIPFTFNKSIDPSSLLPIESVFLTKFRNIRV